MREQGAGTIVNVSSIAGRVAQPAMGPYTGAKHAMEGLSDALRVEVTPFGVDVVLVEPGWVQTRIGDKGEQSMWEVEGADSPYTELHENGAIVEDVMLSDAMAGEVSKVAVTVREAAESPDPDPRYVVTLNGKLNMLQRHLPDRMRDWLFEKMFWGPTGQLEGILPGTGD
jgi:NAD(P)-dependent dehydrogenase (short-subunit alcohol dehydrogenase family)